MASSGSGSWSGDNRLTEHDRAPLQPNLDATGCFGAEDGVDKRDVRDPKANSHLRQGDALWSAGLGEPQVPDDRFCYDYEKLEYLILWFYDTGCYFGDVDAISLSNVHVCDYGKIGLAGHDNRSLHSWLEKEIPTTASGQVEDEIKQYFILLRSYSRLANLLSTVAPQHFDELIVEPDGSCF